MESAASDWPETGLDSRISLICADLDRTIVDEDLKIAPETVEAIWEAEDGGVRFVLCSGRMHCSTLRYHRELGLGTPIISYNGAMAWTPGEAEPLYHVPLPEQAARDIVARYTAMGAHVLYIIDDTVHVPEATKWSRLYEHRSGVTARIVPDYAERFDGRRPTKILVLDEVERIQEMYAQAREWYGDALHVTVSLPEHLEFMHPEATKGKGLRRVAEHLGIDVRETAGIGDGNNDIELLQDAAVGIAMENGTAEWRAVADYIAPPCSEAGAATAIRMLIRRG
ncbi:MAG: Cof-type HAD-IIB family hydrolase [Armatimonadota bacterium]